VRCQLDRFNEKEKVVGKVQPSKKTRKGQGGGIWASRGQVKKQSMSKKNGEGGKKKKREQCLADRKEENGTERERLQKKMVE